MKRATVLILAFLFAGSAAHAADEISTRDTAGAEETRLRQKQDFENLESRLRQDAESEGDENPVVSEKTDDGRTIRVRTLRVTGNRSVSSSDLDKILAPHEGREVTMQGLREIASEVKSFYRDRGLVASYVYIPPQDISSGDVEIAVIEGELGEVEIRGNKWYSSDALSRRAHLKEGRVVTLDRLQAALSELNSHPDIQARTVLRAGRTQKTTDVVVDVEDRLPLHLNAEVNNLGTRNTGRTRAGFGADYNNMFGRMDTFSNRFSFSSGTAGYTGSYGSEIGPWGTKASLTYSTSAVDVGGEFEALGVEGDATTYGIEFLQPVFRKAHDASYNETSLLLGFDWKSVENRILDRAAGNDELRVVNAGVVTDLTDASGRSYISNTVHFGISGFAGASDKVDPSATRSGTGGQFFAYRGAFARYQRMKFGMAYSVRANGQLSPDRLSPSEQFRLGGAFSVRGYAEGDYMADQGVQISQEIYVPTYFFPAEWKLPYSKNSIRDDVQGVGFLDFGYGSIRSPLSGEREDKTLAGVGAGLRVRLYDKIFGRLQWGIPIGSEPFDGKHGVFYYGISAEAL